MRDVTCKKAVYKGKYAGWIDKYRSGLRSVLTKKTSAVISEDVWGIFINRHVFLKKVNQQTSCDVMRWSTKDNLNRLIIFWIFWTVSILKWHHPKRLYQYWANLQCVWLDCPNNSCSDGETILPTSCLFADRHSEYLSVSLVCAIWFQKESDISDGYCLVLEVSCLFLH